MLIQVISVLFETVIEFIFYNIFYFILYLVGFILIKIFTLNSVSVTRFSKQNDDELNDEQNPTNFKKKNVSARFAIRIGFGVFLILIFYLIFISFFR